MFDLVPHSDFRRSATGAVPEAVVLVQRDALREQQRVDSFTAPAILDFWFRAGPRRCGSAPLPALLDR
jgi:hypothetical protein